jgi:predicted CopG family antitoxin
MFRTGDAVRHELQIDDLHPGHVCEYFSLEFVQLFVYARNMKTITLDDIAYERLKAWKSGRGESFSSVIKRVLPEPGTLGAFLGFTEANQTQALAGNDRMEEAVENRTAAKEDPWI